MLKLNAIKKRLTYHAKTSKSIIYRVIRDNLHIIYFNIFFHHLIFFIFSLITKNSLQYQMYCLTILCFRKPRATKIQLNIDC